MLESIRKRAIESINPVTSRLEDVKPGHYFVLGGLLFTRCDGPIINRQVQALCLDTGAKSTMPPHLVVRLVRVSITYEELEVGEE